MALHGFVPREESPARLREHLEGVRTAYLERFMRAVNKRASDAARIGVEVLVEEADTNEPDQIFRLMRADILVFEEESARIELLEGPYDIQDIRFDFAGVPIIIHDLAWENVLFSVRGPDPNVEALAGWASLWLDVGDERPPDESGLRHAIHRLSRPRRVDDEWSVEVDFGSADVDAFIELLEIASVDAVSVDIWIPE